MPFSGAGRSADSDPQAGGFSSMDAKNASQQLILAKSSAAPAAGLFALSYADGGPTRTAPEGLVPLDSRPSPAGGTGDYLPACAVLSRQNVKNTGFSKTAVPYYGSSRFFVNLSCEKMYLGQAAEMDGCSCS